MSAATSTSDALQDELVTANHILADQGVLDAFGHVSVRVADHPGQYLIARSAGPATIQPADLQTFTLAGEQVAGDPRAPYAERAIHGAIYGARPDVLAVCHNHSPSVIPFGVTGVPLRPMFHMAAGLGNEVPVWDIADEFGDTDLLVRSLEQGRTLARALGSRGVALMRGHGSVLAAQSLRDVVVAAVYMELNARLQMQALTLGAPRFLSEGEIERAAEMLRGSLAAERAWDTWKARVTG